MKHKILLFLTVLMLLSAMSSPAAAVTWADYNSAHASALKKELSGDFIEAMSEYKRVEQYAASLGYKELAYAEHQRGRSINPMSGVYALTTNTAAAVPHFGAKYEPQSGSYIGRIKNGTYNNNYNSESIASVYVQLGNESISKYDGMIREINDGSHAIQINWNFPQEHVTAEEINKGLYDNMILSDLNYLAGFKDVPLFLRIGAEMNCWHQSNTQYMKPEVFKAAYTRIAQKAREICPNVALVFSLNGGSYWMADIPAFYPGNAYVDYIGISVYASYYINAWNLKVTESEAEQVQRHVARFSSPMNIMAETVENFPNMPIMITECGFAYCSDTGTTTEMTEAAIRNVGELYSSVFMIYPQVKSIIYFDDNPAGMGFHYKLGENSGYLGSYLNAIQHNPYYLHSVNDTAQECFTPLTKYSEKGDVIKLRAYSKSVNSRQMTITYAVDGETKAVCTSYPYAFDLDITTLSNGFHQLKVSFDDNHGYREEKTYTICTQSHVGATGIHFKDVNTESWYVSYIYDLVVRGILSGINETTFDPEGKITRGQFVKILAYASGDDLSAYSGDSVFADANAHWSKANINWAYTNKIVYGKSDTQFAPDANITRQEMAVMIKRYADYKGITLPQTNAPITFTDEAEIAAWAKEAVSAMQQANIISGFPDGTFAPQGNATRAQAAKMISVFLSL